MILSSLLVCITTGVSACIHHCLFQPTQVKNPTAILVWYHDAIFSKFLTCHYICLLQVRISDMGYIVFLRLGELVWRVCIGKWHVSLVPAVPSAPITTTVLNGSQAIAFRCLPDMDSLTPRAGSTVEREGKPTLCHMYTSLNWHFLILTEKFNVEESDCYGHSTVVAFISF